MGCEFDEFTDKAWTNHFEPDCNGGECNDVVMNNRRMLYNVMTHVGFTNLPSEWWHFDYGDDKWAQLNHTVPLYAGILDAKLRCSVPYLFLDEIQKLDNLQQSLLSSLIKTRNKCRELSVHMTDLIIANTV